MKDSNKRGVAARAALFGITLLAIAGTASAQSGSQAPRPAAPAAQAAQPAPFTTVQQVCQMREREIAMINSQLLLRNQALSRETDAGKRAQIVAPVAELRANLRETETSWERMDCVRLLYSR